MTTIDLNEINCSFLIEIFRRNTDLNVNFSGGSQNQKGFNNYEETKMSGDINNNQFHE